MTKEEFEKLYNEEMIKAVESYGLGPVESVDGLDDDAYEFIMSDEFLNCRNNGQNYVDMITKELVRVQPMSGCYDDLIKIINYKEK